MKTSSKILIGVISLLAVLFVITFFWGYEKAGQNRGYAEEADEATVIITNLPKPGSEKAEIQVPLWEQANNQAQGLKTKFLKKTPPDGSENLFGLLKNTPSNISEGYLEMIFLDFLEKADAQIDLPTISDVNEGQREIEALNKRLESIENIRQGMELKAAELKSPEEALKSALENYRKDVQTTLDKVKHGESTNLSAANLHKAISELKNGLINSAQNRFYDIERLKREIDKVKSQIFVWPY